MHRKLMLCVSIVLMVKATVGQIAIANHGDCGYKEKDEPLQFEDHFENSDESRVDLSESRKIEPWVEKGAFWHTNVPLLPIIFAESDHIPEGPCKRQARRYLRELKNGTLWAVKMFDSSAKYPVGILAGHLRHFGNFDECYNLHAHIPSEEEYGGTEEISGRYCLASISYQRNDIPPIDHGPYDLEFDPNESFWEVIRERGDFRRVPRQLLELALCVPSSCSAMEIEAAIKTPLERIGMENNLTVRATVPPKFCQTLSESPVFSKGAVIYSYIVLGLIILVAVSTYYDVSSNDKEPSSPSAMRDLFLCFSARRNVKHIFVIKYQKSGLDSIHWIRTFFMLMVIYGHRAIQYQANPVVNAEDFEKAYNLKLYMFLINGPIIVDGFFAIAGLLLAYHLLGDLDKKKRINFFSAIMIRYIRLVPSFALIIFLHILILPHLGSGPLWKTIVEEESHQCSRTWWSSLLFINNYVDETQSCVFQSWYLNVDFHAYVIALFVVYAFWRMPRYLGYFFLGTVTVATAIIPFIVFYIYEPWPVFGEILSTRHVVQKPEFTQYYTKTHLRLAPYFVGVIAGTILYDQKYTNWKLSKLSSHILTMSLCIVMSIMTIVLGFPYYNPNYTYTPLEGALYGILHRIVFAIGTCAVVILLTVGQGLGFYYYFMTPKFAQPLGRLSYAAFLVHYTNQMYDIGIRRIGIFFSVHTHTSDIVADLVYTIFFSFLIVIGIESPFRQIEHRFILNSHQSTTRDTNNAAAVKKIS